MARKIFITTTLSAFIFLFFIPFVEAGVTIDPDLHPPGAPTISGDKPTRANQQSDYESNTARILLTQRIVSFILGFAGIVAIFFIVNNAWYLIASGGSEETITQHKKGLMWAVVGLILIILSYSIIRFIISIPFQADEKPSSEQPAAAETGP